MGMGIENLDLFEWGEQEQEETEKPRIRRQPKGAFERVNRDLEEPRIDDKLEKALSSAKKAHEDLVRRRRANNPYNPRHFQEIANDDSEVEDVVPLKSLEEHVEDPDLPVFLREFAARILNSFNE